MTHCEQYVVTYSVDFFAFFCGEDQTYISVCVFGKCSYVIKHFKQCLRDTTESVFVCATWKKKKYYPIVPWWKHLHPRERHCSVWVTVPAHAQRSKVDFFGHREVRLVHSGQHRPAYSSTWGRSTCCCGPNTQLHSKDPFHESRLAVLTKDLHTCVSVVKSQ